MAEEDEIDILEENEEIEKPKKGSSATPLQKKKVIENPAPKAIIKKKIVVVKPVEEEEEEEEDGGSAPQRQTKEDDSRAGAKPRRERTQKQIEAFNRCIETKKEKAKQRAEEARRLAEYDRKALEEKVVKKAISIKKKQIQKQSALDEISDDDEPIEKIKEIAKRSSQSQPPKQPQIIYRFV